MAQRGFKRFKAISQINFIPIELPPSAEQRLYERVQWMFSSHPLIRAFRQFGGRSWLHKRFRRHGNWTFPHGSSGPFGDALPGRWLSHDEVISTFQHMLTLQEQKISSPFWNAQGYSFWVDVHGRID